MTTSRLLSSPGSTNRAADRTHDRVPAPMPPMLPQSRVDDLLAGLQRDGIVGLPGAFEPSWADELGEDVAAAFEQALARPDGALSRGPNRWYVEIHPEQLRGFVDLVTHPWITAVAERLLGPDYVVVEVGFDVPLPGALDQPWHRDFVMPQETREHRRLSSLAVNVTTVDTTDDMGPFEIVPGTQFDDDADFEHGMFPPPAAYPAYEAAASRRCPRRGDISIRSALTIHRGTANRSSRSRPVLVLGLVGSDVQQDDAHGHAITRGFRARLAPEVLDHLRCPVVDELAPVPQRHTIEGLVMGQP